MLRGNKESKKYTVFIPKQIVDPLVNEIIDVAKREGRFKELYVSHNNRKLYGLLDKILAPLREADKQIVEEQKQIEEFLGKLIGVKKKKSKSGHKVICLKLKKKLVGETDEHWKFEFEEGIK